MTLDISHLEHTLCLFDHREVFNGLFRVKVYPEERGVRRGKAWGKSSRVECLETAKRCTSSALRP